MQIADYYTGKGKERARVEIARAFSTCCEFLQREQSGIDFPLRKPVARLYPRSKHDCSRGSCLHAREIRFAILT